MRWTLLLLTLAACSPSRRADIRPRDVGPRVDSGVPSASDAAERKDASEENDASDETDAGEENDASDRDDASDPSEDASAPHDGGTTMDSGIPPLCWQQCTTSDDCATENAIQDADNWLCTAGLCEYRGCLSDAECNAVFNGGYVCVLHTGYVIPGCVADCTSPSDCTVASPLFEVDNYACESGGCRWLGCNDSDECRTTFNDQSYVCEPQAGLQFKNCVRPCSAPTDCGAATSPAFDADNYSCTSQRCVYLGCFTDAECQGSFPNGAWECR